MPRGRKPDTSAQQEDKGSPSRRKKRSAEQRAQALAAARHAGDEFGPPDFMGESSDFDGAVMVWRELSPDLKRLNLLERLDRYSFAMYCVHMADWIATTRDIAARGANYKTKTIAGEIMWRLSPSVRAREIAERHILELGERFGFNPTTRFKLLREQSLIPDGGLFGKPQQPPDHAAPAEDTLDPIGFNERNASTPTVQ